MCYSTVLFRQTWDFRQNGCPTHWLPITWLLVLYLYKWAVAGQFTCPVCLSTLLYEVRTPMLNHQFWLLHWSRHHGDLTIRGSQWGFLIAAAGRHLHPVDSGLAAVCLYTTLTLHQGHAETNKHRRIKDGTYSSVTWVWDQEDNHISSKASPW